MKNIIRLQSPWQELHVGTQTHDKVQRMTSQRWCSVETDGDGACSIHSVFGKPNHEGKLKCDQARIRMTAMLGNSFAEFKKRVRDDTLVETIATMLWGDLVYPCALRDVDREAFGALKAEKKMQAETSFAQLLWKEIYKNTPLMMRCREHAKVPR